MKSGSSIILIAIILFCTATQLAAQTDSLAPVNPPGVEMPDDTNQVYSWVDINPEFPGGEQALMEFLKKNIVYPDYAIDNNIQGTVWTKFTVAKDGKISDVKIAQNASGSKELADESIRVIQMMPNWKPGIRDKRIVACTFQVPIKYVIKAGKKSKRRSPH